MRLGCTGRMRPEHRLNTIKLGLKIQDENAVNSIARKRPTKNAIVFVCNRKPFWEAGIRLGGLETRLGPCVALTPPTERSLTGPAPDDKSIRWTLWAAPEHPKYDSGSS